MQMKVCIFSDIFKASFFLFSFILRSIRFLLVTFNYLCLSQLIFHCWTPGCCWFSSNSCNTSILDTLFTHDCGLTGIYKKPRFSSYISHVFAFFCMCFLECDNSARSSAKSRSSRHSCSVHCISVYQCSVLTRWKDVQEENRWKYALLSHTNTPARILKLSIIPSLYYTRYSETRSIALWVSLPLWYAVRSK